MILLCSLDGAAQVKSSSTSTPNTKGIKIGLVDNSKRQYRDGCGCSFRPLESEQGFDESWEKLFLAGNHDNQAWMNVDGKIMELRLVKDTTRFKGRKGDRYYQIYKAGDITVHVKCVATGFGDTHSVACDATIIVIKGGQKRTVKAEGDCGC
jgi:hypothetical protein